jgi:hypothetical protein
MKNFDPFPDWEKVDQEMADDLHQEVVGQQRALKVFESEPTPENAAALIEFYTKTQATVAAIITAIWTQPVMVHVAGERKWEKNPDDDDQEALLQRCTRCKSVLNFWFDSMMTVGEDGPRPIDQEEIPWWENGEFVAKGDGESGYSMYLIEKGRELEKHEFECVGMPELEGGP